MNDALDKPLFVHSGIRRSLNAAAACGFSISSNIKEGLFEFLTSLVGGQPERLMFPAFNYDYGRNRCFNVDEDAVQVGSFPEFVRTSKPYTRSTTPFFSVLSSRDLDLDSSGVLNPFGAKSAFQKLKDADGTLLFAGAGLLSITYIHYIEEMSGGPLYRYDKRFPGKIVKAGSELSCDLSMHVRPLGVHMDYDWPRLFAELKQQGILKFHKASAELFFINTVELLEFWGNKLADDPLPLLDEESLAHFKGATNNGTRRVCIEEYENV